MKVIVTHASPDLDAITSVWLIKKFLPGWNEAEVRFVPAGERLGSARRLPHVANDAQQTQFKSSSQTPSLSERRHQNLKDKPSESASAFSSFASGQAPIVSSPIEKIGEDEVIHVDTGLGPLDHHQTPNDKVCAASLTWDYVKRVQSSKFSPRGEAGRVQNEESERVRDQQEAIERMVRVVVEIDHFKEVFWENPLADYHEFSLLEILDGLKLQKPNQDNYYVDFCIECLDAILHDFENRIWAEKEIAQNGKKFTTRFGQGIGFETLNDSVIKLAQKMGYVLVVRKDPRKGYTRIKARPSSETRSSKLEARNENIDLTLAYEQLKKMDPQATWFLHVSKKMLLNGTAKNPKMVPTKLSLDEIIRVLEKI